MSVEDINAPLDFADYLSKSNVSERTAKFFMGDFMQNELAVTVMLLYVYEKRLDAQFAEKCASHLS